MSNQLHRRQFIKNAIAAVGTTSVDSARPTRARTPTVQPEGMQAWPIETVPSGFVGVGSRGTHGLRNP